jgi:hypothetical protein
MAGKRIKYTRDEARSVGMSAADYLYLRGEVGDKIELQRAGDGRILTRVFRAAGEAIPDVGHWLTLSPGGTWCQDPRLDGMTEAHIVEVIDRSVLAAGRAISFEHGPRMITVCGVITPSGRTWTAETGWINAE